MSKRKQLKSAWVRRKYKNQLRALYGDVCVKCRRPGSDTKLTLDHVFPHSLSGPFRLTNLQLLCQPCNLAKGSNFIDYRPFHPSTRSTKTPEQLAARAKKGAR